MSKKSRNEVNHERFAEDKARRLKDHGATRHNTNQKLKDIDLDDLDGLDDMDYNELEY